MARFSGTKLGRFPFRVKILRPPQHARIRPVAHGNDDAGVQDENQSEWPTSPLCLPREVIEPGDGLAARHGHVA